MRAVPDNHGVVELESLVHLSLGYQQQILPQDLLYRVLIGVTIIENNNI